MYAKEILNLINDETPALGSDICSCACCGVIKDNCIKFSKVFSKSTFNMNHDFRCMNSEFVCSECAVFFSRDNWVSYCERNGKDYYFPSVENKKRSVANWMFFSHAFYENGHEIVTDRKRWRELLANPPASKFCFVISTMCKKHLIFKTPVQFNRDDFIVRFEADLVRIQREKFIECLSVFESLYSEGLSKSSIKTGDYNTSSLLKADREVFEAAESMQANRS